MSENGFWRGVKQETIAGIGVAATVALASGIFYLVYTVPTKLDDVLQNQVKFEEKIGKMDDRILDHEQRLIKLEIKP
jgi:hypothetical protein